MAGECLPEGCKVNKEASKYIMRVTDKANLEASNELFAQLVEEIHKRGMRVILDGVFNHVVLLTSDEMYLRESGGL